MRPDGISSQVCVSSSEHDRDPAHRAFEARPAVREAMPPARAAGRLTARARWRPWSGLGIGLALILASAPARPAAAQAVEASSETALKAAFLYNFARFVSWPDTIWPRPGDPLVFGLVGADPLAAALEESIKDRDVQGHPLTVRRVSEASDLAGCHVLFAGTRDRRMLSLIIATAGRQPMLTVGDSREFAKQGGMITFVLKGSTLGFEINRPAAELSGLRISSKLLKLATVAPD